MTVDKIHTKIVPWLQALLWLAALCLGTVSFQNLVNEKYIKLVAVLIIFLVFIWESAITFLDFKSIYAEKNFTGKIFHVNIRLFTIIPLAFFVGGAYALFPQYEVLFYLSLLIMGWLKLEIASFANNIECYLVDIRPTFRPNNLSDNDD